MSLLVRIAGFITFIGLPQALGYASAYHTRKFAPEYYPKLKKPFWAPPTSILKPLWTVLYTLMGFASYLVWRQKIINNVNVKVPLILYGVQLFFNLNWAPLFFRIQSPLLALYCITLNLITATLATITYYGIEPISVKLMIPYLVALTFLGYLNKSIWRLNQPKIKSSKSKSKKSKRTKVIIESSDSESEDSE